MMESDMLRALAVRTFLAALAALAEAGGWRMAD
jgi:hypothetical protein